MSTEPRVREAHSDEASLLHDILLRAFSEYEGRLDPPSGVHSETIASVRNKVKEGGALICEAGGVVAGCAFYAYRLVVFDDVSAEHETKEVVLIA